MKKPKITNKELKQIGIKEPGMLEAIGRETNRLLKHKNFTKSELLSTISDFIENPSKIELNDHPLSGLALILASSKDAHKKSIDIPTKDIFLRQQPLSYPIYGPEQIEAGALQQMENAMRLPIALAGALMPDAHEGYGLPIGGVLATAENIVIPYAVGVDIACRMCMSIFALSPDTIETKHHDLKSLLGKHTIFGVGSKNQNHIDTSLFEKHEWSATKIIKQHRNLAYSQLGTSGGGNHFTEWGELEVIKMDSLVGVKPGKYLALLSHSGSRGFGNEIATFYSHLAMDRVHLPREAKHLAWLDLSSEEGHEYWIAMNLAGDYASANHHEIHTKISRGLGIPPITRIENHHNFAWKERLADGSNVVVHRKGATPAGISNIGIIPGSMTRPGFIVRGKGNPDSINSASHGAGRSMSRSKAFQLFTKKDLDYQLQQANVDLIGGDLDEVPMAYKDIEKVMALQSDLVEIIAIFHPRIVRMADPERRSRRIYGDV